MTRSLVSAISPCIQKYFEFRPISTRFGLRARCMPCPAALPSSLAWQPCPPALPGSLALPVSLARRPCLPALPACIARQPCPAAFPGSLARQPCTSSLAPAALHQQPCTSSLARQPCLAVRPILTGFVFSPISPCFHYLHARAAVLQTGSNLFSCSFVELLHHN
jgi:hypothetical protein